jgi:hypothetical protein
VRTPRAIARRAPRYDSKMRMIFWLVVVAAAVRGDPLKTHTASLKTAHFEVHFRPGSRAAAAAPRAAAMAERDLATLRKALEVENDGSYRLFLYDDSAELSALTGVKGVGAFASGRDVHLPFGDDQTRKHEIAHVVTARLPKSGDEARNMAFPDGIANALLEYVHGVHVHAVAKYYKDRRQLPKLQELLTVADFYGWLAKRPGFNGYDVAASWFRFLLDSYGVEKVKRYYTGTPAKDAFGEKLTKLEKAWHGMLDAYELASEVELLLRRRHGEEVRFDVFPLDPFARLPDELRGKEKDWKALKTKPLKSATPNWVWQDLGRQKFKHGVLEAVLKPSAGAAGVAIRFGDRCEALVVQPGAFLFAQGRALGSSSDVRLGTRTELHVALVRRGGEVEIWVDGFRVLTGRTASGDALPGVGIAGGTLEIARVRVRKLRP